MSKKWTKTEFDTKYIELNRLYVIQNRSITEIGKILGLGKSTIYDRLVRFKIPSLKSKKLGFNNMRHDIKIPTKKSNHLAEFVGIMLGDGHINKNQITVTLGNKESQYVNYVANLIKSIFGITPKIIRLKQKYYVVYFGSVDAVRWFLSMGLAFNKVKQQVGVPNWIFNKDKFIANFLRGFFDTDGSIYKLKFGIQICYTNRSQPLLAATSCGLTKLGFNPSKISNFKIYLTRKSDVEKFFSLICPANKKHIKRYNMFLAGWDTQAVNEGRL